MTDEQNNETSQEPDAVEETPESQDAPATGPVAEDDSSSSQAAGEEPSSTPPVDEAQPETAEEPAAEEAPAEVVAEEIVVEAVEEAPEEPKKKDAIPGADLEPIAVEPEKQLSAEEKARLEAEEEEKAKREAALAGVDDSEAQPASREPAKMEAGARFLATGKRKCSIARVTLLPGDGKVEINKRDLKEFFPRPLHQTMAVQPLTVSGYEGNVDVRVRVHGGGISGQAGAVRHGIARALTEIDPELRGELKRRGFLTRDARVKERRKAGFKKARKKPQFSKR